MRPLLAHMAQYAMRLENFMTKITNYALSYVPDEHRPNASSTITHHHHHHHHLSHLIIGLWDREICVDFFAHVRPSASRFLWDLPLRSHTCTYDHFEIGGTTGGAITEDLPAVILTLCCLTGGLPSIFQERYFLLLELCAVVLCIPKLIKHTFSRKPDIYRVVQKKPHKL